jgi:hypothetical protein
MSRRKKERRRIDSKTAPTESVTGQRHSESDACQSNHPYSSRRWENILDFLALALAIFSMLFWLPSYLPNLHIDHRGETDPASPFNVAFSVTNDGYFSVSQVDVECRVNEIILKNGASIVSLAITKGIEGVPELRRSDTYDALCEFESLIKTPDNPVARANIDIAVTYRPRAWPKRIVKCANFRTIKNSDGSLHWLQKPADYGRCTRTMGGIWLAQPSD